MVLLLVLDWPIVRGVTFDVLFVVFKVHLRLRSASRGCATSGLFHEVGRSERQKKPGDGFPGAGQLGCRVVTWPPAPQPLAPTAAHAQIQKP